MVSQVVKRDGRVKPFDGNKIIEAVSKAGKVDTATLYKIVAEIGSVEKDSLTVEEIQDMVEEHLMTSSYSQVARDYIIYRNDRSRARKHDDPLRKSIYNKLMAIDYDRQNANVDGRSFGGRKGEADSEMMKDIALYDIMSEMARNNHLNNEIYTHDLSDYPVGNHNCLTVPIDKPLNEGFVTRQTDVRPANSANTALQLIAVLFQLQSLQQFGGVSASHLDWSMVVFIRKSFMKHYIVAYLKSTDEFSNLDIMKLMFEDYTDELGIIRNKFDEWVDEHKQEFLDKFGLSEKDFTFDNKDNLDKTLYQSALYDTIVEVKQGCEGLYHNLNTLQSRSGNQLPFSSINYGTCTLPEGRLIIRCLLEVSLEGLGGLHKTSIFPCGIFQWDKDRNAYKDTPNYDLYRLALKSTAKRLYPNYANINWSGNKGYDPNDPKTYFSTMGCRTANGLDINADEGVNPQTKDGRGNICPATIILPTLAMKAKESLDNSKGVDNYSEEELVEEFIKILDTKIHEAKDQLIERYEYVCSQDPSSAGFMYENGLMLGYKEDEGIRSALKHGTLAIGQLGLAETLKILVNCYHDDEKGMNLAKRVEGLFRQRADEFKKEYKLNFGVYYTPAENLCHTAMMKFKNKYGVIEGVSDKKFFTNSMHIPVWIEMDPFEKIDLESQLTGFSNAGCITYVEVDSTIQDNIDALETIVNYAMEHDIPYFAVNVPNDTCLDCGFIGDFGNTCPVCGSHQIQHLKRVTGYLTGDFETHFNDGKIDETKMRVKHWRSI